MSSDTYYFFATQPVDKTVKLCVIATPAGGVEGCAYTRSFVLQVLVEAADEGVRQAVFPFASTPDWTGDAWMRKNVGKYIESTVSPYDLNGVPVKGPDKGFAKTWSGIAKRREKSPTDYWGPVREAIHTIRHYWIDVVATDARYLAHLRPGVFHGTASYDSWPTDKASKRTSLKGGSFGMSSTNLAARAPEYVYP